MLLMLSLPGFPEIVLPVGGTVSEVSFNWVRVEGIWSDFVKTCFCFDRPFRWVLWSQLTSKWLRMKNFPGKYLLMLLVLMWWRLYILGWETSRFVMKLLGGFCDEDFAGEWWETTGTSPSALPVDVSFFQIWPTNFRRNTVGVVPNQFRRNDGWDHTDKTKYRELTLKPGVWKDEGVHGGRIMVKAQDSKMMTQIKNDILRFPVSQVTVDSLPRAWRHFQ